MSDTPPLWISTLSDADAHRTNFEPGEEPVSDAVVRAVSAVTDTRPENMEPIDAVVDPIVFDALVRRKRRDLRIGFTYHGRTVTVESHGEVIISPEEEDGGQNQIYHVDDVESVSEAVVRAIADVRGVDTLQVEPLYDYIEPDALDDLFDTDDDNDVTVSFHVDGLQIEIASDDSLAVRSDPGRE